MVKLPQSWVHFIEAIFYLLLTSQHILQTGIKDLKEKLKLTPTN